MSCNCAEKKCKKAKSKRELLINMLGIIFLIIAIASSINKYAELMLYIISYFLIGYEVIFNAIKSIFKKQLLDENFLMLIATIGAFFINEFIEGIAVLIFYRIGETLQEYAVNKSRKRVENALNLKAEYANLKVDNDIKIVNPNELNINDIIIIKAGEKVAVDSVIIKGESILDVKALTGESLPKEVKDNDSILSGSINIGSLLEVKVLKKYEDSTISKIIELIENANNNKSEPEKFITKFAKIYTPIVILIAILIAVFPPLLFDYSFNEYLRRALIFLVVSCPCALVLSVPLSYFAGIGTCGKKGILVKGSNYLDLLINSESIVFDKTGTLTKGTFEVVKIVSMKDLRENEILEYIALCEIYSNHPIAKSIVNYYQKDLNKELVSNYKEISGYGIKAKINKKQILVGNAKLLDKYKIEYINPDEIGTIIYLSIENECKGYIVIADIIKKDSINAINSLKQLGINNLVMLTGDNKNIAKNISKELKLTNYYAELLPQDKVKILNEIKNKTKSNVIFIGDGINDSPVLAVSDVGISMGSGSDIAIESADIVLMTDEPSKIVDTIIIAKNTRKIVMQNIILSISIKIIFLILSGMGLTTMWMGVFADVGVSLLAVLNATRIMKTKS